MSNATAMAEKRAIRRAAGLCTECDEKALPGRSSCQRHVEMQQKRMERYNARRKRHNLCYCGKPRLPRRTRCGECLSFEARQLKATAKERTAQGLCRSCGTNAVAGKTTVCLPCRIKRQQRYDDRMVGVIRRRVRELVQHDRLPLPPRLQPMARRMVGAMVFLEMTKADLKHWRPTEGACRRYAGANPEFEGFITVIRTVDQQHPAGLQRRLRMVFLVTRTRTSPKRERIDITFIPVTTEVPWRMYD